MRLGGLLLATAILGAACGGMAEEPSTTATDIDTDRTQASTAAPTTALPTTDSATPAGSAPVWFGDHISVDDCFDDTYDEDGEWYFAEMPVFVDCEVLHDNEAYHVFTIDDGTGSFPGDEAFDDLAAELCRAELATFLGADPDRGGIDWWWGWPLEEQWDAGARQAFCAAYLPDAHMIGSMRGVETGFRPAELPAVAPVPAGAVYDDLSFSEDGDRVASFLMPPSTLEEAIEAALAAATEAGLTPTGAGRSGSVFVFRFEAEGVTYPVTVYEQTDGEIEWWLYFPSE
ncbi:MAG TPA: septum formation family protein [Acidimicrobiia bacterium]|nr:septum formation family protein [Acidimicrobiia bacterium]